jgi:hypothetical protein
MSNDYKFYENLVKSNSVLDLLKKNKHTPFILELDGNNPVLIDLLNTLIPLAEKIKNPKSEVKKKLCDLICILLASQLGDADKAIQEIIVRNEMEDLDMNYLTLVYDETRPKN